MHTARFGLNGAAVETAQTQGSTPYRAQSGGHRARAHQAHTTAPVDRGPEPVRVARRATIRGVETDSWD